jgi:DNA polymerase-1
MSKLLLAVDGNALVHRAFHALPPLTSPQGELVNAVYGVASMLLKALAELRPQYLVACFDTAAPTFRHGTYEAYKATRTHAPEGLHEQFARVYQLFEAFGAPIYRLDGYEADDLLGTLARQAVAHGLDVVILTGDLDALQLVGPHVRVLASRRGVSDTVLYDEAAVRARYGLTPAQIVDFKALRGDPSDNIPGVPGIGDKTAAKLLADYGDVGNLYAHLDDLPAKLQAQLAPYAEQVQQARRLAQIVTDLPVTLDLQAASLGHYQRARVAALFHELGFRSLLDRLPPALPVGCADGAVSHPASAQSAAQPSLFDGPPPDGQREAASAAAPASVETSDLAPPVDLVTTPEALQALVGTLRASHGFALVAVADGPSAMRAALVGLALAPTAGVASYIPLGHREAPAQLPVEQVVGALRPVLEDPAVAKRGHDAKFALVLLARHGVDVRGLQFDSMIAAYLLESSQRALTLRDLAYRKLGLELPSPKALLGEGRQARTMDTLPVEVVAAYAGQQATVINQLEPVLRRDLETNDLTGLYHDLELPLTRVLAIMERHGVLIDVPYLQELSRELHAQIQALEREIYALAGHPFNIGSPTQLSDVLFGQLGLKPPAGKRTKTGHISTNVQVLNELRGQHPIVELVLKMRQLTKLKSTYVDALPLLVHPETGRVHTSFNQTLTTTGRVSSSDPNLQNIPIRTELGRRVRQAFIAPPGCRLVGADYSQIELRILAHVTGEPALVEAFERGEDIHAATAARVFNIPIDQVTPDQRRIAKTINFGVLYRISDYGLATRLGLPHTEAAAIIREYFARYPSIKAYQEALLDQARRQGYVTTLLGRRRYVPELHAKHAVVRQTAERMAVNAPIQGTAADIIKRAMIAIQEHLEQHALRTKMILQVHDELVFEAPDDEVAALTPAVKRLMESAYPLRVPLEVEIKTGRHWGEMTVVRPGEEALVEVEE